MQQKRAGGSLLSSEKYIIHSNKKRMFSALPPKNWRTKNIVAHTNKLSQI